MIICPHCNHHETSGAIFCSECGTILEGEVQPITLSIDDQTINSIKNIISELQKSTPQTLPESGMALSVIDSGYVINLSERDEFTLGRFTEGQPILPDIDLSPHNAYEYGVSRLHASIKISKNRVTISDLGSVNGTRINGQKIPPNKHININHGDILTLGKLKLQLLIR